MQMCIIIFFYGKINIHRVMKNSFLDQNVTVLFIVFMYYVCTCVHIG